MTWIRRMVEWWVRFGWLKESDWAATRGKDGIASASSWARHIVARDFPGCKIGRAVIVVEVIDKAGHVYPIYAGNEVELSQIILRGLLSSAQDLVRQSATRGLVDQIVNQLLPQAVEEFRSGLEGPSQVEVRKVTEKLLKDKLGEDPTVPKRRL